MRFFLGFVIFTLAFCAFGQGSYTLALELEPAGKLYSVSPSGRYAVVDSHLAPLTVWDLTEKRIVGLFAGHRATIKGRSNVPVGVGAVAIRDDGWLLSSQLILPSDGLPESGLIAHNLQTGQSQALVSNDNCMAVIAVPDGFLSSCNTSFNNAAIGAELVHWQVSPSGLTRGNNVAVPLLSALDFNLSQQKIVGVEAFALDVFTPVRMYNYPSLSFTGAFRFDGDIPFMVGNGQRTLLLRKENRTQELYDVFGGEGPVRIGTIDYAGNRHDPVSLNNTTLVGKFQENGVSYNLFDVTTQRSVQGGLEPQFATTLGWAALNTGSILWTGEQTTYYLPSLRLWTTANVATETNISNYAFVFNSTGWNTLAAYEIEQRNTAKGYDTLYHANAEAVARQFLSHNDVRIINQDANSLTISADVPVQDDSISAERYELSFRPFRLASGQNVWGLYEVRKQHQCSRGSNVGTWTNRSCL